MEDQNLPHHEDREAFQHNFATDVKKYVRHGN